MMHPTPNSLDTDLGATLRRHLGMFALLGVLLALFVIPDQAFAGTATGSGTAAALDPVWQMLVDFTNGTLGRIITLLIIVVGIGAAILTQSLGAFAVGIGAGIGLSFAEEIINALFGAALTAIGA
ncbi:TraA family conjugative transfer protein [Modicisalibacter sp. MOD 31.J]|uniref:TraA family conjugative transfer protein n=1 Tax=Modicisalibacter sp. MOD 31.J TaxID=2831897 RepID=UPI001CCBAB51|nr:TraA family conjugative transfer protein [Modicisalibacter sp. MOD 31.J]MBZ9574499.1 conjugal transfer protein TraA [Modicisalibacter sp. MOD 31.J]